MKILLIDDDKDDQTLFCEAVQSISGEIECDFANDGVDGLTRLKSYEELPSAVFLDVNMPKMDGRETLKAIRATPHLDRLNVIMYSTSNSPDEISQFEKMGARYKTKPNSFNLLVELLVSELSTLKNIVHIV